MSAVAGQECPRQGARPSLLGPAGQTEGSKGRGAVPSQLARETSRGASTGPSSGSGRRGAGRPGGHEGVPCEPRFSSSAFSGGTAPLAADPRAPLSSVPSELSTRCHHRHHRHAIPSLSAPTPTSPCAGCLRGSAGRRLLDAAEGTVRKGSGPLTLRLAHQGVRGAASFLQGCCFSLTVTRSLSVPIC